MWEASWWPFSGARTIECAYCGDTFAGLLRSIRAFAHYLFGECADVLGG